MALKIDSYRFGEIKIDGQVFQKDVLIFPDRVSPNWWRAAGHSLCLADLEAVLDDPPDVLIIGQGAYSRMAVPEEVQKQLTGRGIQIFLHPTKEACELYNRKRGTQVVTAALHLTC